MVADFRGVGEIIKACYAIHLRYSAIFKRFEFEAEHLGLYVIF